MLTTLKHFFEKVNQKSCNTLTLDEAKLIFDELEWVCITIDRNHGFAGLYLGEGLGSVTDYGRSSHLTNEEMIVKVQEEQLSIMSLIANQFIKYNDDGRVANTIMIVRKKNGYSVIPKHIKGCD